MTAATSDSWRAWLDLGEARAFEAVVKPLLPMLADAARRTGLDASAAEDAVQDALADLARTRSTRPAEIGFAAWLLRAVRLRSSTMLRGERRRRRREAASPDRESQSARAPPPDVADEVDRALAALGDVDREALRLRHLYDLEYREMAFLLGISEGACRLRVHRAAERLRARFGERAPALLVAARLPQVVAGEGIVRAALARAAGKGTVGGAGVTGGLAMGLGAKVALGGAAALLLVGGWFAVRGLREQPSGPAERGGGPPPAAVRPPEEPRLAGRLVPADGADGSGVPALVAAPPGASPAAEPGVAPPADALERLIARIRREVEPEAWTADPAPTLDGRSGVLIVRASTLLQDAVQEFLDQVRADLGPPLEGEAPAAAAHAAPADPAAAQEATERLRTLLLQMAEQEDRIVAIHQAAGDGRREEADRLLALLREEEPDHPYAGASALDFRSPNHDGPPSPFDHGYPLGTPLASWAGEWPGPTRRSAVRAMEARAGLPALALTGEARAEVLERGRVTFRLEGAHVLRVLREIQALTRVDVLVDPSLVRDLLALRIPRFEVASLPLSQVLDQVLAWLAPGHRWTVRKRGIHLVRDGVPATMRIRYFDVRDLLGPQPPPPEPGPGAPVLQPAPAAPPGIPGGKPPPAPPTYVLPPR